MDMNLARKLRAAAQACSAWDSDLYPPYTDWSDLMNQAADAIEELLDDAPFNEDDDQAWRNRLHGQRPVYTVNSPWTPTRDKDV